jgi:hypothetical protein
VPPRSVKDTATLKTLLAKLGAPAGQPAPQPSQPSQPSQPAADRPAQPRGTARTTPAWHALPAALKAVEAQTGLTMDECKRLVPNLDAFNGVTTYAKAVTEAATSLPLAEA